MKIHCPECNEAFEAPADIVGRKARCGACEHVFVVTDAKLRDQRKVTTELRHLPEVSVQQQALLSLYLAGMALLLLLFRGHQGGMMASILLALAIESAALFLAWRGLQTALPLQAHDHSGLVKTAILVNGILLGLLGLSLLLTLYMLLAGTGSGSPGGLGNGAGDIMKYFNELQKQLPR